MGSTAKIGKRNALSLPSTIPNDAASCQLFEWSAAWGESNMMAVQIRDTTRSAAQVDADECACEAEIIVPLDTPTLLMQEIAERVAVATMIRDTPGNSQAVLLIQTHCTQGLSPHHDVITGLQHTHSPSWLTSVSCPYATS